MDLILNTSLLQNYFSKHVHKVDVYTHLINRFCNDFCLIYIFCDLSITPHLKFKR